MKYILFDDQLFRNQLKPFTLTRPTAEIRVGINTINEKWATYTNTDFTFLTEEYLQQKYTQNTAGGIYLNGSVCPNDDLWNAVLGLSENEKLETEDGVILAIKTNELLRFPIDYQQFNIKKYTGEVTIIKQLPDIYLHNGEQIKSDFEKITNGRVSQPITDSFTKVYAPENVFVEEGASIKACILNAENGPIYIGKNAIVQEGAIVIGPVCVGESSMVAWGSKIRPNTTLGHHSRVGGEVGNVVFFGHSNKAHDGFLGNTVVGEWCNFGANCNNSNLKNDYTEVKLYNYATDQLEGCGEIFCGLFMGDYTKAGISTMFNTGTVVGVNVNVFGAGFQEKHIPSFSWGGKAEGFSPYRFDKAIAVIDATMQRRNKSLSDAEKSILKHIFDETF